MFISRTAPDKQPSPGSVSSAAQGPASAGYKNPSVSRRDSIIVAKSTELKRQLQRSVALALGFLCLFIIFVQDVLKQLLPQTEQMKYVSEHFFNILKTYRPRLIMNMVESNRSLFIKCPEMLNVHKRCTFHLMNRESIWTLIHYDVYMMKATQSSKKIRFLSLFWQHRGYHGYKHS